MSEHSNQSFDNELSAEGFRFAIVVSRFNSFVTEPLLDGALKALAQSGADMNQVDIVRVPGAWELPIAARAIVAAKKPDAIICLGAVIRGDTPHFDYVAREAARGIADASAQYRRPDSIRRFDDQYGGTSHRPRGRQGRQQGFRCCADGNRDGQSGQKTAGTSLMARHKGRQHALQLLFQWDLRRTPLDEILRGYYDSLLVSEDTVAQPRPDPFAENLLRGTIDELAGIDERIARNAAHWRLDRMPAVDRNILRLAVYEMLRTDTPPAVIIDEALELARRFSGEESVHFINGVLDAVRRELPAPAVQSS